jgi:metal-responsive CopG/Arc/MetJ family transcriptional regulator
VEIVQVVIGKELLQATDRVARRRRVNRSALVRDALRAYLRTLAISERERQDRAGHAATGDREFAAWDRMAAWPDE